MPVCLTCPRCDRSLNLIYVEKHNDRVVIQTLKCSADGFVKQIPVLASTEPLGGWRVVSESGESLRVQVPPQGWGTK